jgi:hypothetical protein
VRPGDLDGEGCARRVRAGYVTVSGDRGLLSRGMNDCAGQPLALGGRTAACQGFERAPR